MTTRDSLEDFLKRCEETIQFARAQWIEGSRQGFYDESAYTEAQRMLEERYQELMAIDRSASGEQKEQLHRIRRQLQQLQNQMTLQGRH